MAFKTVESELPRDRWGRPLISPPDGGEAVAYQRVTTFVKVLEDTFHLSRWQQRMVALGMANRRDLILAATAITNPDNAMQKRNLNDIAQSAIEAAKGKAAATTGTALHSFTERIDRGEDTSNVPEEFVADLAAYAEIIKPFEILAIEGFCVIDSLRVGGSYDRILAFTAEGLDGYAAAHTGARLAYPDGVEVLAGDAVIGDLKTGKSVDFGGGAIAMQLGTYANAVDYSHALGTRSPLAGNPSKKWAIVIHLPAGKGHATLVWFDVEAGFNIARDVATQVHAWRKRKDLSFAFVMSTTAPTSTLSIPEQIAEAPSPAAVRALYARHLSLWTPGLTSLAAARVKALEAAK